MPSPFCFNYFSNKVLPYALAGWDHHLPIYASCLAGMTGIHYHAQLLLVEMGSPKLFCPDWLQIMILYPISTSQVVRMTGLNHRAWEEQKLLSHSINLFFFHIIVLFLFFIRIYSMYRGKFIMTIPNRLILYIG
jgi:hypothetical protein